MLDSPVTEEQNIEEQALNILAIAEYDGDISEFLDDTAIAKIENSVCESYERDKRSRSDWEVVAIKALKDMAQSHGGSSKDYPWEGASNVHYPLLPYAAMQFNARAYPAIVKGDEAVSVKVVGADKGMPLIGPDGKPVQLFQGMVVVPTSQGMLVNTPEGPQPLPEGAQTEPAWQREPGAKTRRAGRVKDYMNTVLFYRMDNWEGETDAMLFQLAAIGCEFRKVWFDGTKHCSAFVPAMKLVVNNEAKSLKSAPQVTEEIDGVFPFQIAREMATGKYRTVEYAEDDHEPRMLLEQQCYMDLDEDGIDEPYIVTIDYKDKKLLRIIPNFGPADINHDGERIQFIDKAEYYVKYEFLPHPEGKFYNIGLAHLLDQYGEVINTIINQMLDANHAATAGGGFVGSGLRIQGQGQSSSIRFRPGEYKTVGVSGSELRSGIYERTFPQTSPTMFNLLDLILGAAKDIASIKDVLSGDASNQGQVGTTLAMIEQGLQVFTAIYKRVYRGMKSEFTLLFQNIAKHGNEETAKEYSELLDDPQADFETDFNQSDMDIRPVSDPSSVTKMQQMARAQFLLSTMEQAQAVGGDPKEILRRVYEAADIEDIEKILPESQPNPMQEKATELEFADKDASIQEKLSKARKNEIDSKVKIAEVGIKDGALQLDAEKAEFEALKDGFGNAA